MSIYISRIYTQDIHFVCNFVSLVSISLHAKYELNCPSTKTIIVSFIINEIYPIPILKLFKKELYLQDFHSPFFTTKFLHFSIR